MLTSLAGQYIHLPCPLCKQLRSTRPHTTQQRPGICRASGDDRQQKGGIDWDREWRKAKANFPKVESSTSRGGPRMRRDQIREQETFMLDIFSQENFFKVAGGLVLVILFVFVFIIGPPSGPPRSS